MCASSSATSSAASCGIITGGGCTLPANAGLATTSCSGHPKTAAVSTADSGPFGHPTAAPQHRGHRTLLQRPIPQASGQTRGSSGHGGWRPDTARDRQRTPKPPGISTAAAAALYHLRWSTWSGRRRAVGHERPTGADTGRASGNVRTPVVPEHSVERAPAP